jgi:peptidoglycan/LPS O-acetylase OafA/YrhL
MVPSAFGQPFVDGVYWTLAYELVFYVAVFGVMCAGFGPRLHRLLPWWAILMFVVTVASPALANKPFLGTYYSYFAAGAIIATFRRHGVTWLGSIGLACACAVSLRQAVRHADGLERETGVTFSSTVVVVATLAFYGLILLVGSERARRIVLPKAVLAGALTYPVYLLHAHIGYVVLSRVATRANQWAVYAALFGAILALAYGVHVLVERRPRAFWSTAFERTAGRAIRFLTAPLPAQRARVLSDAAS